MLKEVPARGPLSAFKYTSKLFFVKVSFGDSAILLNAAVAEEWPPLAHCFAALDAYLNDLTLFLLAKMSDKLALRAGNETVSPELYAVCHA